MGFSFPFISWVFAHFHLYPHLFIGNDIRYREIMARIFYVLKVIHWHHDLFRSFKPFSFNFLKLFIISGSEITPRHIYFKLSEVLFFTCFQESPFFLIFIFLRNLYFIVCPLRVQMCLRFSSGLSVALICSVWLLLPFLLEDVVDFWIHIS